jgi:hypothetical protein
MSRTLARKTQSPPGLLSWVERVRAAEAPKVATKGTGKNYFGAIHNYFGWLDALPPEAKAELGEDVVAHRAITTLATTSYFQWMQDHHAPAGEFPKWLNALNWAGQARCGALRRRSQSVHARAHMPQRRSPANAFCGAPALLPSRACRCCTMPRRTAPPGSACARPL